MPITFRMYLWNRQGRCVENFRAPQITDTSVVHIAVSQATAIPPQSFTPTFHRFIGAANITVHNIAPGDGRVDFVVTVDWDAPLSIVMDITVFDPPAEIIVGQ